MLPTAELRTCTKCGVPQTIDNFYEDAAYKDGRRRDCAKCLMSRTKAARQRRLEEGRLKRPSKLATRRSHLKQTYGMSIEEFEDMVVAQQGRCAICDRTADPLHIDHDHTSGKVRGLLCRPCNQGLGLFRDNPQFLLSAAKYLDSDRKAG